MGSQDEVRRRRGRVPNPEKTAQTRAQVLEAALATFLERGFAATRMADVASRAGLAKGTLYLHFADKEALFEFVLQQLIAPPLAKFRAAAPHDDPPRAALERLFLPLLRELESSGRAAVIRLIIAEGSRYPALAAIHRRVVIEPFMALVREQAERAGAEPLARFPQLMAAPVVMATVWNGLWGAEDMLDTASVFEAFLDLVFGPK